MVCNSEERVMNSDVSCVNEQPCSCSQVFKKPFNCFCRYPWAFQSSKIVYACSLCFIGQYTVKKMDKFDSKVSSVDRLQRLCYDFFLSQLIPWLKVVTSLQHCKVHFGYTRFDLWHAKSSWCTMGCTNASRVLSEHFGLRTNTSWPPAF